MLYERVRQWVTIREVIFVSLAIRYFDPNRHDPSCMANWTSDYLEQRMKMLMGMSPPSQVFSQASEAFESIVGQVINQLSANQNTDLTLINYGNTHFLRDIDIHPTHTECIMSDLPF